jgi:hypothetical protein
MLNFCTTNNITPVLNASFKSFISNGPNRNITCGSDNTYMINTLPSQSYEDFLHGTTVPILSQRGICHRPTVNSVLFKNSPYNHQMPTP